MRSLNILEENDIDADTDTDKITQYQIKNERKWDKRYLLITKPEVQVNQTAHACAKFVHLCILLNSVIICKYIYIHTHIYIYIYIYI